MVYKFSFFLRANFKDISLFTPHTSVLQLSSHYSLYIPVLYYHTIWEWLRYVCLSLSCKNSSFILVYMHMNAIQCLEVTSLKSEKNFNCTNKFSLQHELQWLLEYLILKVPSLQLTFYCATKDSLLNALYGF